MLESEVMGEADLTFEILEKIVFLGGGKDGAIGSLIPDIGLQKVVRFSFGISGTPFC